MVLPKTKDEMLDYFLTENFDLHGMIIVVEGFDEKLEFNRDMEEPFPEEIHFKLPEHSTYTIILEFKVKKRPLRSLRYSHVVKKHGLPMKTRNDLMCEIAVVNDEKLPLHRISLPPEKLPGGMMIRGVYPAVSTFTEGEEPLFKVDWKIEIIKKDQKPLLHGF